VFVKISPTFALTTFWFAFKLFLYPRFISGKPLVDPNSVLRFEFSDGSAVRGFEDLRAKIPQFESIPSTAVGVQLESELVDIRDISTMIDILQVLPLSCPLVTKTLILNSLKLKDVPIHDFESDFSKYLHHKFANLVFNHELIALKACKVFGMYENETNNHFH
jgi:hypothetical protein